MTYYADYTTFADLKTQYLDITQTTDDGLLAKTIRDASRQIERSAGGRTFAPRLETRYYDLPRTSELILDDDLLTLTTLTNGSGTAFVNSDYKLYPLNERVKHLVKLLLSASMAWQTDASGNVEGAISVTGAWGYAKTGDWIPSGSTLSAAITTTTVTTFIVATGTMLAQGHLIQIDSEWLYVSSVSTGITDDLVTVVRGVNGSTAATHLTGSVVSYWRPDQEIEILCQQAAAAAYRIRANPTGDTVVIDGTSFATPKDVNVFISKRLVGLGLMRVNFG